MAKIQVILGSTRQGRSGDKVAAWVMKELAHIPGAEYELLDLRDYPLPFFDEPVSPGSKPGEYTHEEAKRWSEKIKEGAGYILVTPEYNHGYPAVLKNALDYLYVEWNDKPVGFVSYGGAAAGARSVEQLTEVVRELHMIAVRDAVLIPLVWAAFDAEGALVGAEGHIKCLKAMVTGMMKFVA